MGKTSRSRATVQTRGVAESRLRAEQKRADHSKHDPQALLTKNAVREFLDAFLCPWCDRGPFKAVAMHVSRAHGVGPKELRDAAGLFYSATLTDSATHAKNVARGKTRDAALMRQAKGGGTQKPPQMSMAAIRAYKDRAPRVLSEAAKERNRRQLDAARAKGSEAAARASKEAAEKRFMDARPSILRAYEAKTPLSDVAISLGVSNAQIGRWARKMGLADGRALAAQWRAFPKDAINKGREEAEARKRAADISEWESSCKTWAAVVEMSERRSVSLKAMRARLKSLGIEIDGRSAAGKKHANRKPKRMHCDIASCPREHVARGLCRYHYQEWRLANGRVPECAELGCGKPVVARKVCGTHYARIRG